MIQNKVFVLIIFFKEIEELQIFFFMINKKIGVAMDMKQLYIPLYPLQLKQRISDYICVSK